MAKVIIPFPLRKFVDNQCELNLEAANLADAITHLQGRYPELKSTLDDSVLLSVFVNNKMVDGNNWGSVSLQADDEVALIIPIAGG
jgi:molybdopterin converting factor small subunit